jgi:nucleotide-binding universal stress UspA family protein
MPVIEIKKVLLPIDFSKASTVLLPYAIEFAEKYGARLFIIFVAEDPFTYSGTPGTDLLPDQYFEDMVPRAERKMATFVADNISKASLDVEGIVLTGHPAEEIINYANQEKMDLLIIGSHGFRGFERFVFGSVAEQVIKMAPCPVLTINTYERT